MAEAVPEQQLTQSAWMVTQVAGFEGGLNRGAPKHLIQENQSPNSENVVVRDGRVLIDTGYAPLGTDPFTSVQQILIGDPRRAFEHVDNAGNRTTLCVTDSTLYKWVAGGYWVGVGNGTATTLSVATTGGEATITVASPAGFTIGNPFTLINDAGDVFTGLIANIVGSVISVTGNLPNPFVAAIGKAVNECQLYAGDNDSQVVVVAHPGQEWTIFTNGVDNVQKYNGTIVVDLVGLFSVIAVTAVKAMSLYKDHLVVGNFVESGSSEPNKVRWPDTGLFETWNSGNAGFEYLHSTRDPILCMKPLGDDNIIYRTRSIVRHEYVGTSIKLFNFRTTVHGLSAGAEGVGVVSQNSVFPLSNMHLLLSRDGIYRYQGGFSIQKISDPVFPGIFDAAGRFAKENGHRAFVQYIDETDEVFFFYPIVGATYPERALILNLRSGAWSNRVFPQEFSGFGERIATNSIQIQDLQGRIIDQNWNMLSKLVSGEVPTIVLGGSNNKTYEYNFLAGDDAGTAIPWFMETAEINTLHRSHRYHRYDFLMAGDSVTIAYSIDGGSAWVTLGTVSPGAALDMVRLYKQIVADRLQLRFSGSGRGAQISSVALMHREERRWGL